MTLNSLFFFFQLVIGCQNSSQSLSYKRVSPLKDRDSEEDRLDSNLGPQDSDDHLRRPQRMNNGSLMGDSSGQSSSRMSHQTDSSGKNKMSESSESSESSE